MYIGSVYCPEYGKWKKNSGLRKISGKNYVELTNEERWARTRWGNIRWIGNKLYMNVNCKLCRGEKESLEHTLNCREFKKVLKEVLRLAVEEIMRGGGNDSMF